MTTPTAHWHAEHVNFARLLNVLEQQLQAFHRDEHPDYELMLDICDYLQNFPDVFHHPREDVAFARLVQRDAKLKAQVDRLTHEHRIIAWAGKQFKMLLEACVADSVVGRAEVEACASMYLVYYRHHLNEEERDILPAAAKLLTPEDWAAVAAAVPIGRDPVFGDERLERFRALRWSIESAVHAPHRTSCNPVITWKPLQAEVARQAPRILGETPVPPRLAQGVFQPVVTSARRLSG